MSQETKLVIKEFEIGDYAYRAKAKFDHDLDVPVFTLHARLRLHADFQKAPAFYQVGLHSERDVTKYFNRWFRYYQEVINIKPKTKKK